jgi:hypothetical protein
VLNASESQLYERGHALGSRYSENNNIVWLTAGEAGGHRRRTTIPDKKLNASTKGIRDGDTGGKLLTVHANWADALPYKGYVHIGYLSEFLHSLGDDLLKLGPDRSILVGENPDDYDKHRQTAVAEDGSFALVYFSSDSACAIDLTRLCPTEISVGWYNPRDNTHHDDAESPCTYTDPSHALDPPGESCPGHDWVLILGRSRTTSASRASLRSG